MLYVTAVTYNKLLVLHTPATMASMAGCPMLQFTAEGSEQESPNVSEGAFGSELISKPGEVQTILNSYFGSTGVQASNIQKADSTLKTGSCVSQAPSKPFCEGNNLKHKQQKLLSTSLVSPAPRSRPTCNFSFSSKLRSIQLLFCSFRLQSAVFL